MASDEFKKELPSVTRVEVIDENGRSYVNRDENNGVHVSFQDGGRTLKVFIERKAETEAKGEN